MKGYKIAVGIDRENGPFPVMIELEIPDDAVVITPRDSIKVNIYSDVGSRIGVTKGTYSIQKYRTDKVKVINIIPADEFEVKKWNGKAYSLFILSDFYPNYCSKEVYSIGKEMETYLDRDNTLSCGRGFHFFKTKNDTLMFYEDVSSYWVSNIIHSLQRTWYNHIQTFYSPDYETLVELSR